MSQDWESRARLIEELAESIGARSSQPWTQWTMQESEACRARAKAALRSKRMDVLERTIEDFGGLPMGGSKAPRHHSGERFLGDLAWEAAADPSAFGFGRIVRVQLETALAQLSPDSEEAGPDRRVSMLGKWLRGELTGAVEGRFADAPFHAAQSSKERSQPVGACFAHDNARALGQLLVDPEFFDALVLGEPKKARQKPTRAKARFWELGEPGTIDHGREGPLLHASMASGMGREWLSLGAALEASLAWQAVASGAFGCAKLLLSIPEFGAAPMEPGALGCSNPRVQGQRPVIGKGLGDEEEPFELFEQAVMWGRDGDEDPLEPLDRQRRRQAQVELLLWMVANAPKEALEARPGLSWPELVVARQCEKLRHDPETFDSAFCLSALSEGVRSGFTIDWAGMSKRTRDWIWDCGQHEPQGWSELTQWVQLQAQTAGRAAPSRPAPSL